MAIVTETLGIGACWGSVIVPVTEAVCAANGNRQAKNRITDRSMEDSLLITSTVSAETDGRQSKAVRKWTL